MKKVLAFLVLIVAGVAAYLFMVGKMPTQMLSEIVATPTPQPVDYTASFEIYTYGTKRIFTAAMYHNLSGDVYIESSDPSIVRVKKAGVTWGDFFASLPMKLTRDFLTTRTGQTFCNSSGGTLGFFINDSPAPDALDQEIKQGDKLLVTYK